MHYCSVTGRCWPQHRTVSEGLGFVPTAFLEAFQGGSDVGVKLKMGTSEGQLSQE